MATAPLSLFNTPQQYQQQQWMQAQEQAKALAEMSNQQRATYGAAMGGQLLGNALPSLLGVEDPELAKIKDIQGMFRGVDRNDYKSLESFAKALADKGYAAEAEQAWQKAQEAKRFEADIGLKNAQRDRALRDPSFREYEYESAVEALKNAETPEEKKFWQDRIDALNAKASKVGGGNSGTGQLVAGSDGYMYKVDKGTGQSIPVLNSDGTRLAAAQYNAGLQGNIAAAKSGNAEVAKEAATAQASLPKMTRQVARINRQLDELLAHPGFSSYIGASLRPGASFVDGTPEASFKTRFEQLNGASFSQAYETLKGGGAITEMETKQAGAALNRMSKAQSEAEFRAAAEDFRDAVRDGLEALQEKANMKFNVPTGSVPVKPPKQDQARSAPFSGVQTPNQVRDLYRQGKLTKQEANAILGEMKNMGLF